MISLNFMNLFSIITSKKFLIPTLFLFVTIFIYSLWERIPDIDDAWIGELAYWLAEDGQIRSELMRGITLQEDKFVVSNKLFVLLGAGFINVFGFSLYTLKSISLVFLLLFLFLFRQYTLKWKSLFTKKDFIFALIILFSFPWIFKYSFLYRPELMMMTIGFSGYILLEKYIDENSRNLWILLASGLLFGFTIATHLNGVILVGSAGLLLIWNKKYLSAIWFGLAAIIGFLPYFFDMTSQADFELWRHQFFDSPALDSLVSGPIWMKPLFNLMEEHMRYFDHFEVIAFSVFMLVTLVIGSKHLFKNHPTITRFALLVALLTGLIAMHKSRQYILLNFPYLLILITLTIKGLKENTIKDWPILSAKRASVIKEVVLGLLVIFLISSTFFNFKLAIQKFNPDQNRLLTDTYLFGNSFESNVIAPMTFIFNEIESYNRIQGEVCYIEMQKADPGVKGDGFLRKANEFNVDLIMLSPFYQKILGVDTYKKGSISSHYKVLDKNAELVVFKRLH